MGVSYLLDTHVFLWLLGRPDNVPENARTVLADRQNQLLVSAVSALEVATKVRVGKLDAAPVVSAWSARVGEAGADELAIDTSHALLAGELAWDHRDPFDRLLVAQALVENLTLVTTDAVMADVIGLKRLSW